jgi:hexosaminidase
MLPDEALQTVEPPKVAHAALNKPVRLSIEPDPRYPGFGAAALTDGVLGAADHNGAEWLGWMGKDVEAVIDLGAPIPIRRLGLSCLQATQVGIFLPKEIEFAVSTDGTKFEEIKKLATKPPTEHVPPQTQTLTADGLDATARYVRVRAVHLGPLPAWVTAGSVPAWLFLDEILVNATQPAETARTPTGGA